MPQSPEVEELRVSLDRIRTMLESLVVRGLRACGGEELAQLRAFADELQKSGAGHVASSLSALHDQIQSGDRGGVKCLLMSQTSVRLLERLLTLRVVKEQYALALAQRDQTTEATEHTEDDDEDTE